MRERHLTETEVRHMLQHSRRYGRSRHHFTRRGVRWGIVVRPRTDLDVVEVVTVLEGRTSR